MPFEWSEDFQGVTMRKIVTVVALGIAGWVLAGCEQQQDTLEPATGLPQNEREGDSDIQIGRGDPIDEPEREPAAPPVEREIEPNVIPGDQGAGDRPQTQPQDRPVSPEPQN
nr:hypothetical protein [Gammaproteobacteria bacterium]